MILRRRRSHRALFLAAGIYNLAWGSLSIVWPQWLFALTGMAPANHPQIFASLGMVVGLYGLVYLEIARRPETGWAFAAVALIGKVAGPAGLAMLIGTGTWPWTTAVLCLTNDVVWWVPFSRYLHDAWPIYRLSWATPTHEARQCADPRGSEPAKIAALRQ